MLMLSTTMMINPTSVDENNWAQEIWQYSQWQILILSIIWVTGVMKSDRNVRPRKKYGLQPKQIQSNISPNLMEVSCGAGMDFPIEMKYEKQSKEIQSKVSPNLMVPVSHSPALRRFPDTLWRKKQPKAHPKVNSDAWESYIPDICHGYHGWYPWRKICHVEKFDHMTDFHVDKFST